MILFFLFGCAVKGGVELIKAHQEFQLNEVPVEESAAQFERSMADLYLKKSWEEYADSQFEISERYAKKSQEWLKKAIDIEKTAPVESSEEKLELETKPDQGSDDNLEQE